MRGYELNNGWIVRPFENGIDVFNGDEHICELNDVELWEFKDEWGDIDEAELIQAINEEMELCSSLEKKIREN